LRAAKGSVVLTASNSSFHPGRGGVLYVASKFAVRGVVVALAHELAPDVRVNAVAPGGTLGTDLRGLEAFGEGAAALAERPGREDELRSRTPLAVALTPADHAAAYVFLASEAARGMTGTFLHSDGGIGVKG
jgi:NAD(P)-dependent dehydrogenase (short-subunit alcohol dehydrogenase family)